MSLEISPEAVIFSLRSQINGLNSQIIDLENAIVEIPEIRFRTVEVRNLQGFFSGDTKQVLVVDNTRIGLIRGNAEVKAKITTLKNRISSINSQIILLKKDIEVKQIPSVDLQEINGQKDNTLRNALLIGGALLIL